LRYNKKIFRQVDITLPLLAFLLVCTGLVMISSATQTSPEAWQTPHVQRQVVSAIIGFLLMIVVTFFDYRLFRDFYLFFYGGALFLLAINLMRGAGGVAAQRSISIGPLAFQPSELTKLGLIILLSYIFSQDKEEISVSSLGKSILGTVVPFLLILQNDLGTSLVLGFILLVMLYIAGFPGFYLLTTSGGIIVGLFGWILAHLHWGVWLPLKEYQLMRIIVFWNPGMDPFGYGYHLIQSKIAIGSGNILGKGLFEGTQSRLNFIPEQHTDFIFSVLGEETGFIGASILLTIYLLLLLKGLHVSFKAKDRFGSLLAAGITSMFGFHVFVNIGMTMGVFPVTGLPLPFVSYGGSALTTNLLAIGILINIYMRRQKIYF